MSDEHDHFQLRDEQLRHRLGREHGLSRRDLVRLGASGALVVAAGASGRVTRAGAQAPPASSPIVKPLPPEWFIPLGTNAEMRWEAMRGQRDVTPAERFFVRNHTSTPLIDPDTWRLRVFGSGLRDERGIELGLRDLLRLPSRTLTASVECAGNGRSFFGSQQGTPVSGTQWKLGAIGVARWRGVPLREVLERAAISRRAVDVMPTGLDPAVVAGGIDQGHVRRPLPAEKALDDALLAYEMNGAQLLPDHGFPLRLVVPGWVGIASIKWLGEIEVADRPLYSYWNTTQYRMVGPDYPPDAPPLTTQPVKSAFELAFPATLPAGRRVTLHGRSWSGNAAIRRVRVRVEGRHGAGRWREARLHGSNRPRAWVRWTVDWRPPTAGEYALLARATDATGATQPDTVPPNTGGYQFWAVVRHPVTAVAAG